MITTKQCSEDSGTINRKMEFVNLKLKKRVIIGMHCPENILKNCVYHVTRTMGVDTEIVNFKRVLYSISMTHKIPSCIMHWIDFL